MSRVTKWCSAVSPGAKLVTATVCLLLAAAGILILEGAAGPNGGGKSVRQFQRMAGGLGLGATVRPRWCFVNFDPRLERCTCTEQPVAAGYCYCPEHTGTVSYFVDYEPGVFDVEEQEASGR